MPGARVQLERGVWPQLFYDASKWQGERLHERRVGAGLRMPELALLLGVDQRTVARWERGELVPRPTDVLALAYILGQVRPTVFFAGAATVSSQAVIRGAVLDAARDAAAVAAESMTSAADEVAA